MPSSGISKSYNAHPLDGNFIRNIVETENHFMRHRVQIGGHIAGLEVEGFFVWGQATAGIQFV
jgi:hypothetical protein